MLQKIQILINRYPFLRFLTNKYYLVGIVFVIWMLFLDNYSYLEHKVLNAHINDLNNNKTYYKNEIKKDSAKINQLKNIHFVEKYAREKYYMKKDSEDIYIIDIEEDHLSDSIFEAQH
jgi:cell division protein DivIC